MQAVSLQLGVSFAVGIMLPYKARAVGSSGSVGAEAAAHVEAVAGLKFSSPRLALIDPCLLHSRLGLLVGSAALLAVGSLAALLVAEPLDQGLAVKFATAGWLRLLDSAALLAVDPLAAWLVAEPLDHGLAV